MGSKFFLYIRSHGSQLVRFIIVGLATFALNIFLVWLFYGKAGIDYRLAATYAYFITVVVHFILNRSFTYRHEGKLLPSDIVKYCLMLFSNYVITLSVTTVTVEFFLLTPYHGTIFSTFITAFSSFLLMKYFVFTRISFNRLHLKILLITCLLLIAGAISYKDYLKLYFVIEMQTSNRGASQIYFDTDHGYNEQNSSALPVEAGSFCKYSFPLPSLPIKAIRFDPINASSIISIKNARIENIRGETLKTFSIQSFKSQQQISRMDTSGDVLTIHTVENANDPVIEIQNSSFDMKVSFVTFLVKHGWLYASYVFFSFMFLMGLARQPELKSIIPPKRLITFPIVATFLVLAILSAFQLLLLKTVPHSPYEDLARHVALALNFHDALLQGQFIPRLQSGSVTVPPDIPVFQYYGFLSSLFAQPGLFFGFAPLDSLVMGVVIIRWLAAMAIYITCRIQNLSQQASILAVVAWLSFPYIQSNLYGRVAFSETFAQAVLTFIPLSWALASRYSKRIAALTVMLTIFLLAIAHPIFLMWGALAIAVMVIAAFIFNRRDSAEALLVGLILGVCMSSFQWLPAILSHEDLAIQYASHNPFAAAFVNSFSGFTGFPTSFTDINGEYYFDVSMWIIPSVIAAIAYFIKEKKYRADIFINMFFLLAFIFAVYSPVDFWQFLPKSTWATQFPYRLLSFVAIFGAIVLAYACDSYGLRDHWIKMTLVALLILLCSGRSLIAPAVFNADGFSPNKNIATDYASLYYLSVDSKIVNFFNDGWLQTSNFISVPAGKSDKYLYLEAKSINDEGIDMHLINTATKDGIVFVQNLHIPASGIKTTIRIPAGVSSVSLVPVSFFESSVLPVIISSLYIGSDPSFSVLSTNIDRTIISPYKRSFSFSVDKNFPDANQYVVSLPLAYSKFQKISQGNRILMSKSTVNGLTQVVITDLKVPVISCYKLPLAVSFFTITGFLLLIAYIWFSQQGFRRASE